MTKSAYTADLIWTRLLCTGELTKVSSFLKALVLVKFRWVGSQFTAVQVMYKKRDLIIHAFHVIFTCYLIICFFNLIFFFNLEIYACYDNCILETIM